MILTNYGWNNSFEEAFKVYKEKGYEPGRVVHEGKGMFGVITAYGELAAETSGKMKFEIENYGDYPAVGDWVVLSVRAEEKKAIIHDILPRYSKFSRKAPTSSLEEQIIAANIDTIFLVNALSYDFSLSRMERYLTLAWDSGANPVFVLSKADLAEDVEEKRKQVEELAMGVPVQVISSVNEEGIDELTAYFVEGKTVVLLGQSGAGKSTLVNRLLGEERQKVSGVRGTDGQGRHTTTNRELILLPEGGMILDTPGMRRVNVFETEEGINQSFQDIESLAKFCKFNDCEHFHEPGCAVKQAIENGSLEQKRFKSYQKFQREAAYMKRQIDKKAQLQEKAKWKKLSGDRTRTNRR